VIEVLSDQKAALLTDLKFKFTDIGNDIRDRVDQLAVYIGSTESLSTYVSTLLGWHNPMEIISVYEELSIRIESLLETSFDACASGPITFISFKKCTGETTVGELIEEQVAPDEFIERCKPKVSPPSGDEEQQVLNLLAASCGDSDNDLSEMSQLDGVSETQSLDHSPTSSLCSGVSVTASVILEDSFRLRSESLTEGPVTRSDAEEGPSDFTRQDPIRRTISFPLNNAPNERQTRSHSVTDAKAAIPNGASSSKRSTKQRSRSGESSDRKKGSLHGEANSKKKTKKIPRPKSVIESWLNHNIPGLNQNDKSRPPINHDHNMRGESSEDIPVPIRPATPVHSIDLANPNLKIELLWEKVGVSKLANKKGSNGKRPKSGSSVSVSTNFGIPELRQPNDVCILPNADLIVADSVDRNLQILSTDKKMWSKVRDRRQPFVTAIPVAWGNIEPNCVIPTPHFKMHLLEESLGISDHQPVVITDNKDKCIKIIDTRNKGTCVSAWGKSWFMPMFKQPSGLTLTEDRKWVISDIGKNMVTVHDTDGRSILQFGSRGKGCYGFEQPRYVLVDDHGRIMVSDSGNGGIKVFDKNGQFLLKIGHQDNANLTCPMGMSLDGSGNIAVADKQKDSVWLFSYDGRPIRELLTPSDVENPTGLALSDLGYLAVTQTNSPAVKLYSLQT